MPEITHDPEATRFTVDTEVGTARLDYILSPGLIVLSHTEVPVGAEGRGLASALAKAGLDYARAQGLRVMPLCPFVAGYIRRHPEERDLLMPGISV
ncbi:MAG: GNAT family N-acetyltransferase [Bacteroidota bacterium]